MLNIHWLDHRIHKQIHRIQGFEISDYFTSIVTVQLWHLVEGMKKAKYSFFKHTQKYTTFRLTDCYYFCWTKLSRYIKYLSRKNARSWMFKTAKSSIFLTLSPVHTYIYVLSSQESKLRKCWAQFTRTFH